MKMEAFIPVLTFLTILSQISSSLSAPSTVGIVGGENATIEQYPYQISLHHNGEFHCGGSILNALHILTAAHCLRSANPRLTIRAGSSFANEGGVVRNVVKNFTHPKYNTVPHDYDIAILKLDQPLTFNKDIAPIKLPVQNTNINSVDGLVGVATGYGRLYENGPLPKQLQMVKVPTIAQSVCQVDYTKYHDVITDRMFCIGYPEGGKDTCQGDSGGPFAVDGVIIGITSWSIGCAERNLPGVFTRVSYFVDYINSIISN